jgi:DNA-directed RNA polymerase specialized sigma24 family protein
MVNRPQLGPKGRAVRAVLTRRHVAHVPRQPVGLTPPPEALALVAALPERKRTFLALKVAGFSYDEIAAELGVSWLTVNRQLVRPSGYP